MGSVGVAGLGAMGSRMAGRLIAAGYQVVVWNRSQTKVGPLAAAGARVAASPAELAREVPVVLTMLAGPTALREVSRGPEGLAASGAPFTLVEMSTVGPAAIETLASDLPAEASLIDAPVLGSLSEAESGSLQIFVGASPELFAQWSPLLSALGSPLHVGPLGSGAGAKLVANSTLFGVLGVLGEALGLARGLGLSREVALQILGASPLGPQVERRQRAIESGDFPLRFRLALARKDAQLVVQAARETGVDMRLASAALSWIAEADDAGWGDRDYSSVLARIAEQDLPTEEDAERFA